ncbi:helix-turn-helix domain-containing protein [Clostridium septicum]|uniref:Helix-turn-helix transcriptional regulator n=1 Tax=Clostridium septicum TaxID=1504 RepID=A0A9N7PKG4_CLOSE|nr:helix-turn-helix transcriptional regulator [Clostridium septicum]AYE35670.1 XRE family transcriptional regulator [Clostridium septicum]UEC19662.1 helix-turn-helix transcriptional regulator [Clostridium septicum]USS02277.1 helix-turn-helix transcriptional regulator [Clostridium septicum]WLF70860.1 helix-turn-helix transcriptional regulator [Clostridium septicum]
MKILTWNARVRKDLTLVELAKLTGISKSTLNNIENGKVIPKISQLEAIAKATDTRIIELFESEYK